MVVNFNGDNRICVATTDQLPPNGSLTGNFVQIDANTAEYSFDASTDYVFIVGVTGVYNGVVPISSGPAWFQTVYKWSDLVANIPNGFFTTNNTDGGFPAGADIGPFVFKSGDSNNRVLSRKRLESYKIYI